MSIIVQIENPIVGGRRFAIGDIHGCEETFRKLVERQLHLKPIDQLFLLGDYIDRGPSSSGVIEYIFELQAAGFQVFTLLGNHEQMLIEEVDRYKPKVLERWMRLNKTTDLLEEGTQEIKAKYLDFINSLPYCFELDRFLLVHAGFNFNATSIFTDPRAMLWVREMHIQSEKLMGKTIVHGHTPKPIEEIRWRVANQHHEIILDNGCVYHNKQRKDTPDGTLGRLCALDLDSYELFEEAYCG